MKFGIVPALLLGLFLTAHAKITALTEEIKHEERGVLILKEILSQPWAKDWKGATLKEIRLVRQKPDLDEPTGLPPVWSAKITGPEARTGHLMWDCSGEGKLVEFALDAELKIEGPNAAAITGIPGLQEFPMKDTEESVGSFGMCPDGGGQCGGVLERQRISSNGGERKGRRIADLAKRLRSRLAMTLYPDTDGFSDNGMALAGAYPADLVKALREDTREFGVPFECDIARFSMEKLKEEITAKSPALLSCVVRVAHKPELSWGHEVAAVGWAKIDGVELAGVLDNFYPTKASGDDSLDSAGGLSVHHYASADYEGEGLSRLKFSGALGGSGGIRAE